MLYLESQVRKMQEALQQVHVLGVGGQVLGVEGGS